MSKLDISVELRDETPRSSEAPEKQANLPQRSSSESKTLQISLWIFPRAFALIFIVILFTWIFQAEGGLGFNEESVFGWHALLMGIFIVLFTQEAILSFSVPLFSGPLRSSRSPVAQWFHVICHVLGIICAMLGIVAIVYYKNLSPQPVAFPFYAVYSPHSWLGICVLLLWAIQMGVAVAYIYSPPSKKKIIGKIHRLAGKAVYAAGLATCALGLQDMQSSDLASSTPPIPGVEDTLSMSSQGTIIVGNMTVNVSGYFPNSPEAQYSSACTIVLLFLGLSTFGALEFYQ